MLTAVLLALSAGTVLFLSALLYISPASRERNEEIVKKQRVLIESLKNEVNETKSAYTAVHKDAQIFKQKMEEVNAAAELKVKDAQKRIEEFKSIPIIACMTDGQVAGLAEMLSGLIRDMVEAPKQYVN